MSNTGESFSHLLASAKQIMHLTESLDQYFRDHSFQQPSFEQDYLSPDTTEYDDLLAPLFDKTQDFLRLIDGPKRTITSLMLMHYDLAAYQAALEFKFFEAVPLGSMNSIHIEELASAVQLDKDRVGRIMRFLATQRMFDEHSPGNFRHTSSSALLAKDSDLRATALREMDEMFRAASETSAFLAQKPDRSDSMHSPFQTRFQMPIFQYYAQNPPKAKRFATAMAAVTQDVSADTLARAKCDSALMGLSDRVTFQQHDFFTPQPIHDTGAFIIRQCLHNQNDEGVVKILRALVPAMERCRPGTPLLINETILPEFGQVSKSQEHAVRRMDLMMLVVLGAKQRTEKEWREIIKIADAKLQVSGTLRLSD
ncbi:MAG: hypothetical protein Q9199_001583 [Rusavskia elegans]